jgi:hypothetical protein
MIATFRLVARDRWRATWSILRGPPMRRALGMSGARPLNALAATGNSFLLAALTSEAGPWMEVHDAKHHFQGGDSGAVGIVPRRFRFRHG